ncbi:MAG: rhombosortase [Phycisphaerae bacterium]|nr:rhombosortase [Phycisphaerae bacterium]
MKTARTTLWIALFLAIVNVGWIVGDLALTERVNAALQFDRQAVAHGQLWRLATCNLVHYSAGHFWIDLLPWMLVGLLFERRLGRAWPISTGVAMAAIGLAVWLLLPGVTTYRGWSGLCNTAMALGLFAAWKDAGPGTGPRTARLAGITSRVTILLVAIAWLAKISFEAFTGVPTFAHAQFGEMGTMVPLAHWVGAAAGLATLAILSPHGSHVSPSAALPVSHLPR